MRTEMQAGLDPRRSTASAAPPKPGGFTLLEVLIAVLLISLALTALVRLSGLEARSSAHLRDSTLANWVAANALAEARLRDVFPAPGRRSGEETMGGRRWRWELQVQSTDEVSIRRMEVQVFAPAVRGESGAEPVASLLGFAVQP